MEDDSTVYGESGDAPKVDTETLSLTSVGFDERYKAFAELGRGGMGVVRLYRDDRIGREIALKLLRADATEMPGLEARFVREAQVQGQLEHSAIPPVYDIGLESDGAPYFTMQRLRGRTLKQVLRGLAEGDAEYTETYSRRRLLSEFAIVCQAIEFAHTRGVLHRDIKPANIMLGDFGEVYVLDWGVAKIRGVDDIEVTGTGLPPVQDTPVSMSQDTEDGVVLGTPGFMAPEQLTGAELDPRADIYALGAILFEILTLEPLHPAPKRDGKIKSTMRGADAQASVRAPDADVPPELEAICVRATRLQRGDRYPTVRELYEELTRYLEGDRDLARRRELAAEHAEIAAEAARAALTGGDDRVAKRAEALRSAGRALALDPDNEAASNAFVQLMIEPPQEVPEEVERAVQRSVLSTSQFQALLGAWCYLLMISFTPFVAWMGSDDRLLSTTSGVLLLVLAIWSYLYSRAKDPSPRHLTGALALNCVALVFVARLFGPLVIVPGIACASTVIYALHQRDRVWAGVCVAFGCAAILIPLGLQWLGVMEPSYEFTDGAIRILPNATNFPPTAAMTGLVVAALGIVIAPVIAISRVRRQLFDAERRLHMQTWQLRQLVPGDDLLNPQRS